MKRSTTILTMLLVGIGVVGMGAFGWAAAPDENPKLLKKGTTYQQKKTERIDNRITKPDQRVKQESTPAPAKTGVKQTSGTKSLPGANATNAKPEDEPETGAKKVTVGGSIEIRGGYSTGGKRETGSGKP